MSIVGWTKWDLSTEGEVNEASSRKKKIRGRRGLWLWKLPKQEKRKRAYHKIYDLHITSKYRREELGVYVVERIHWNQFTENIIHDAHERQHVVYKMLNGMIKNGNDRSNSKIILENKWIDNIHCICNVLFVHGVIKFTLYSLVQWRCESRPQ